MFGQWALGEEALGEIDGPETTPVPADVTVWFTVSTTTEVKIDITEVTEDIE